MEETFLTATMHGSFCVDADGKETITFKPNSGSNNHNALTAVATIPEPLTLSEAGTGLLSEAPSCDPTSHVQEAFTVAAGAAGAAATGAAAAAAAEALAECEHCENSAGEKVCKTSGSGSDDAEDTLLSEEEDTASLSDEELPKCSTTRLHASESGIPALLAVSVASVMYFVAYTN